MCSQNKNKNQKIHRIPPLQKVKNFSLIINPANGFHKEILLANPKCHGLQSASLPSKQILTVHYSPKSTLQIHTLKLSKLQNISQSPASLFPQKPHYKYSKPFLFASQQTNSLSLHFSLIFPPTKQIFPYTKRPEPSRQLVSPPEARRQGSNSQQRPLISQLRRPEE